MELKEEFLNVYNKGVREKLLRRLPKGQVDKSYFDEKIAWTRKCLNEWEKLKTQKEKKKYWNVNMYRLNRSEVEMLPIDIQDKYIQSYVQYILYKMRIPTLIVIAYFAVLITLLILNF